MPAKKKRTKPAKKTAGKTASARHRKKGPKKKGPKPPLVPQPNGSALYAGGVPGNAGGTGRPKSEVRAAALAGADVAIPKLIAIVEDVTSEKREITAAGKVLLQFGLGTQTEISIEDVKYRWQRTLNEMRQCAIEGLLSEDALGRMLARIKPLWT